MSSVSKKFVVDIWSDYVCPWCWVAKRRFENALASFPYKDSVQVNVRAYRLAPNHVAEPMVGALKRKLGSPVSAVTMMSAVKQYGQSSGLDYRFETMLFGDTADAHVLVKAVQDETLKKDLVEALYEQSTTQGKSLFDRKSLEAIAKSVGVPDESVLLAWSSQALRFQMQEDERAAAQFGSGVPFFVFNNSFSVSGAQPQEAFLQALNQMYLESTGEDESFSGQVCGLDGCN
ncbi:DsbA family oxidoreductase [Pseudomonas sp. C32]|jgi:predicted DsbA family dithiol-disulfide isomerase|uniref:DsbA family oxidoreductase n=1 Tax=Pseudomonas sp. C32 TaxID=1529208 RepID=UPI002632756D|nr:DsbA family oxidoreductase [Pseudomonas sp. C32]MDN4546752.1 DsbA family oxidoreductase [Pseudomonas sp. C32]